MTTPDRYAPIRRHARRRLAALARAAALGGVALAVLAPGASSQTDRRADGVRPNARPGDRLRRTLDRPVRAATPAAARVLGASQASRRAADPTFQPPLMDPFGLSDTGFNSAPSVTDLDGDGDSDVLVGGLIQGSFLYFENTAGPGATPAFAAGQFNPFGLTPIGNDSAPSVADLDGDGDLDVLSGEQYGGFVYFENTAGPGATPAFATAQTDPFGLASVGADSKPSVGDLDGDGDLDVLVGEDQGNLFYFENTAGPGATPIFASAQTNPLGLSDVGRGSTPSVADLDDDGDLDVLSGTRDGDYVYFENTAGPGATPTFASAQTNPFRLDDTGFFSKPSVGDLDGDGDLDVLAGDFSGSFFYFENAPLTPGALTFAPAEPLSGITDIGRYSAPSVADIDGDGRLDVLAGAYNGDFFYFEGQPALTFAPVETNPFGLALTGYRYWTTPSVADLDGDGDLDVLAGESSGDFFYFENTAGPGATPAFAPVETNPFGLTGIGSSGVAGFSVPSVADLDGDGDLDVLSGRNDGSFVYFENTAGPGATPAFAAVQIDPFGLTSVGSRSVPSVGDLDGDGDLDVLAGQTGGDFIYFENTAGPGTLPAFAAAQTDPFGLMLAPYNRASHPAMADIDGDGDLDVISGDYYGDIVYFENTSVNPLFPVSVPITGGEGWRMLSAPAGDATVDALLGTTHTQGFPGADAAGGEPTVFFYDESAAGGQGDGYRTPTDQSETVGLGRGVFAYLYADDDVSTPGTQGGFPKTLTVIGDRPRVDFDWRSTGPGVIRYTNTGAPDDDGWNLLGNPFGSWFDWDAADLANIDAPVYIYDSQIASYRTYTQGVPAAGNLPGGIVAPFQGFWVKANAASPRLTALATVSNGGPLYKSGDAPTVVGLRLRPADGGPLPAGIESQAFLALGVAAAESVRDRIDALALAPAASAYVSVATDADGSALAIDARPEITGETTVELSVSAVGADGSVPLVFDWPGLDLPDGWTVRLLDREAGTSTVLADGDAYAFSLGAAPARSAVEMPRLTPTAPESLTEGRFALVVTPANIVDGEDAPTALSISPVMPNPARGMARLALSVSTAEHVRIAVYDALGRQVAVLADGEMSGAIELRIDTARLAAGVYVVRVEGESFAETRRLTVVR